MGFFHKIDNSVIGNTCKQFLSRTDREIFHGCTTYCYIPQECALLSVEAHKNHTLVGRHQRASMSVLDDRDRSRVCSSAPNRSRKYFCCNKTSSTKHHADICYIAKVVSDLWTTTTITTFLRLIFRDHPGEPVPEENFWTLWCKGRLTEAYTLTIRLGATPSGLTSTHLHHPPIFFAGQMPFLPPSQQRQSTEGN